MQKQYDELKEECVHLSSALAEATAKAERAAEMMDMECKRQVADMAARMRGEETTRSRGQTPSRGMVDAQVERLLAEMQVLNLAKESLGEQLQASLDKNKALDAECDGKRVPSLRRAMCVRACVRA